MSEEVAFDASWLYDSKGNSKLCTTLSEYTRMLAEGWDDSPAKFNIETHPSNPVQALQMGDGAMLQQLGIPAPFSPTQEWGDMLAMLQQMQGMMDGYSAELSRLVDRMEVVEMALSQSTERAPETSADKGKK